MNQVIRQRANADGFPKAGELIEFRTFGELTLRDKRNFNLLIENAGKEIANDVWHEIALKKLRHPRDHASERVADSIDRIMSVKVKIPTKDPNGKPAILTTVLIAENLQTIDETDSRAILRYKFTETIRNVVADSQYWGRLKGYVIFAFSSKYALSLYEAVCLRINLQVSEQLFPVDDFRRILDVPEGKLKGFPQLNQSAIKPAVLEVNALSDFNVDVEVVREGGSQRGKLKGFRLRWSRKSKDEWQAVTDELMRSRIGRKARITGTVEQVVF